MTTKDFLTYTRPPSVRSKFFWGVRVVDGEEGNSGRRLKWDGGVLKESLEKQP